MGGLLKKFDILPFFAGFYCNIKEQILYNVVTTIKCEKYTENYLFFLLLLQILSSLLLLGSIVWK